jgi:hypothetical protein
MQSSYAPRKRNCLYPSSIECIKKCLPALNFSGIKVFDNLICDGHHRFIASILADFPIDWIPGRKTMATCIVDWDSVIFEENDWDSPSEINRLNQQDADFNNIPMEKIVELLKQVFNLQ